MNRLYCDICKKEIKQNAKDFKVDFGNMCFGIGRIPTDSTQPIPEDICLPCLIKAINKKAGDLLKRKYIRKSTLYVATDKNLKEEVK